MRVCSVKCCLALSRRRACYETFQSSKITYSMHHSNCNHLYFAADNSAWPSWVGRRHGNDCHQHAGNCSSFSSLLGKDVRFRPRNPFVAPELSSRSQSSQARGGVPVCTLPRHL